MYDWSLPGQAFQAQPYIYGRPLACPKEWRLIFYVETWDLVEKLLWGIFLIAVVPGAILLQFRAKFYNFFTFVFFSGYLKIAAGNFSDAGVLTSALKM